MTTFTATYSPDDNKLRLYASRRLDPETYARVKAAGFRWAPKQDLFVAPMWTPEREDLLIELAGEVGDEDTSLSERAEQRAERFGEYEDKRTRDAERARAGVDAICEHIPLGQPILIGHHSERHARRDQERIESGMRRAVKMWDTAQYWSSRAESALRHAKYKEAPAVRHRRIKTLETARRKIERNRIDAEQRLEHWNDASITIERALQIAGYGDTYEALRDGKITLEEAVAAKRTAYARYFVVNARWRNHYDNRLTYERAMLAEQLGVEPGSDNAMAARFDFKPGGEVLVERDQWLIILRVNKVGGVVNSLTTTAPAAVTWTGQWKYGIERVRDYRAPSEEVAAAVKKATALPPICNYPGEGFREMTEAEWKARRKWSDFPYFGVLKATETTGAHRVRQMPATGEFWKKQQVFITDAKRVDPPAPSTPSPHLPKAKARDVPAAEPRPAKVPDEKAAAFDALKDQLKAGVQVVIAPQLFPTPSDIAASMVQFADIREDHTILEPSGGTGRIIHAIRDAVKGADITAVEIRPALAQALREGLRVPTHCRDFLECGGELGKFDRILMNPPFAGGDDIKHIEHAIKFLNPGGRLVAICANGPRQQARLQGIATHWMDLKPGAFKSEGTSVNTAMVVIDA